jgi:hypothetical protein
MDEIEKEMSGIIGGIEHSLDELEKHGGQLNTSGDQFGFSDLFRCFKLL